MKKTFLIIFLLISAISFADSVFKWGGPGYDPKLDESRRYVAQIDFYNDKYIIIKVDAESTVNDVGVMELKSESKRIQSSPCGKAMRHVESPWACSFLKKEVQSFSGKGEVVTYNRKGVVLLTDEIDFDKLKYELLE